MILAVILLPVILPFVMLATVLLKALARRRRVLRLDWPDNITFIGMTSYFKQYMLRNGWNVRTSDDIVYHFVVNKDGDDFVVYCSQSDPIYHSRSVLDLIAAKPRFGNKPLLFVATKSVPDRLIEHAYYYGVYIIHYNQLGDVIAMGQSSIKRLRKLIREINNIPEK